MFYMRTVESASGNRCSVRLSKGEIAGATVYYHSMLPGDNMELQADTAVLKTVFLLEGAVEITCGAHRIALAERAAYVAEPGKAVKLQSGVDAQFLEIQWRLTTDDTAFLADKEVAFPLVQIYDECGQYREDFKTGKCISRSIIDHHALPRFCMGSNESYGPDFVSPHTHPLLDQFFFSFADNQVNLLIDDVVQPYGGMALIHIPLGSNHGVDIPRGGKMHYLWIDFIIDPRGVAYLDEVHKATGVKERFDENQEITK